MYIGLHDLRTYTRDFALRLTKIMKPQARPQMPSSEATLRDLWQISEGLGDTWPDAKLPELYVYLYGARGLCIPPEWEWLFPSKIEATRP